MTDPNILNKARQEERVLLTVDLDFARLLAILRADTIALEKELKDNQVKYRI